MVKKKRALVQCARQVKQRLILTEAFYRVKLEAEVSTSSLTASPALFY